MIASITAKFASTPLELQAVSKLRSFLRMSLNPSVESSLHGGRNGMKDKRTGKSSVNEGSDWKRLRSQSDGRIRSAIERDPDAKPTDAEFWKTARVVMPTPKQTVTIRLDADLLDWLRREKGYQSRINAVLRTYMDAQRAATRQS
jgi:uncharacterized protein (DUF4415 family)